MDIIERLRKHALPDPHDEREVMHAPLLREAAKEIEQLRASADRKDMADEIDRLRIRTAAIVRWLEKNQPDVFSRGLWDAIIETPNVKVSGASQLASEASDSTAGLGGTDLEG